MPKQRASHNEVRLQLDLNELAARHGHQASRHFKLDTEGATLKQLSRPLFEAKAALGEIQNIMKAKLPKKGKVLVHPSVCQLESSQAVLPKPSSTLGSRETFSFNDYDQATAQKFTSIASRTKGKNTRRRVVKE